jgi:hypothetical protein
VKASDAEEEEVEREEEKRGPDRVVPRARPAKAGKPPSFIQMSQPPLSQTPAAVSLQGWNSPPFTQHTFMGDNDASMDLDDGPLASPEHHHAGSELSEAMKQSTEDVPMEGFSSGTSGLTKRAWGSMDGGVALGKRTRLSTEAESRADSDLIAVAEGRPAHTLDLRTTVAMVDVLAGAMANWDPRSGKLDVRIEIDRSCVNEDQYANVFQSFAVDLSVESGGLSSSRWGWTPASFLHCFRGFKEVVGELTAGEFSAEAKGIAYWVSLFILQVEFETKVRFLLSTSSRRLTARACLIGASKLCRLNLPGLCRLACSAGFCQARSQTDANHGATPEATCQQRQGSGAAVC